METPSPALSVQPIGWLRTGKTLKFHALHQPRESIAEKNRVELRKDSRFEGALRDLKGFSRIWLVWWFHRNPNWRPMVLPPRGPAVRRGVFATRSPHRPNPIGISAVQLIDVSGLTLHVGPCDLVDGTPILDIKPYLPAYDAFPSEKSGWWKMSSMPQRNSRFIGRRWHVNNGIG
ncbi:MAG TPA: tRNA (N6-threonylcarbamoyladenosine(37)-N6)-methyltransferase TrmO [Opitutaceae bacterium]|nr:tRNA (N6-threonylcarbamoyladenosine(37)-N6)-methyltransferase TrmO [Opitutaceae bacterium]